MSLEAGFRLGPYEILSPLGAGGMGEVYRARDTRLERIVAIKVLPAHLHSNAEARQRLEREARAVSSLNHPHICTLHDIGSQDGVDFLVMEHLEGETLAARLHRGPLPPAELLRYAIEIADALEKAHRQMLIHRDLKPGNVMLTKSGAKLLDFGLARTLAPSGAPSGMTAAPTMTSPLTAEGAIVGTFQYMAPEQLDGNEADARSDIFGFGLILYEMATGKKTFSGKTQASLIASIMKEEPQPISALQPVTPPALERLVGTCLTKDPDARRQTMHDVLLELRWIAEAGPQAGVRAAAPERTRTRERYLWLFLLLLLGAAGVALGLAWHRTPSVEPRAIRTFIPASDKTSFRSTGFGAGPVVISPDGSRLVFTARREDGTEPLFVRPLDSLVATPLAGSEGASYPFWSPDGRSIGFFADGKLKRIDASGGPALSLCDALSGRGGTWSPEGVILYTGEQNAGLFRVPAAGGTPIEVTKLDKARQEVTHRWPQFLPGGRRFIYWTRTFTSETNSIMAGSLDGGDPKVILQTQSDAVYATGYLIFARETTLMAQPFNADDATLSGDAFPIAERVQLDWSFAHGVFSASENGILVYQTGDPSAGSQLTWYDRSGKETGTIGDKALYVDFNISPDLKKVAVAISDRRVGPPDLWIYAVARNLRTKFTFDPGPDGRAVWSPDSSRVIFSSVRAGNFDLYIKSDTGSANEELLLQDQYDQLAESWSADGRYLAYYNRGVPGTKSDIWVLPLSGDRKPILFLQTGFQELDPQFSPDGRWIAYTSDESGREEIYVAPFPGPGRKWQISTAGGSKARWRQDGREIYYLAVDNAITAVEVGQQGSSFDVGVATPLFTIRAQRVGSIYRVSPDGRRFLVNKAIEEERTSPLTLVVNWTAGLGKK